MPVFSYQCKQCGFSFEELVKRYDEEVPCPKCGAISERTWSGCMYSQTGKPPKKCSGNCATCPGCH